MIKRFLSWLNENMFQEKIHTKPSMGTLKALAKNNKYETARFTINSNDELKAGDSYHHTHQTIEPAHSSVKVRGLVIHHEGKYHYRSFGNYDNLPKDHPILRHFEKAGIENGNSVREGLRGYIADAHKGLPEEDWGHN